MPETQTRNTPIFLEKNREEVLQRSFDAVFSKGPSAGQYEFRKHNAWPAYYQAVREFKNELHGVIICRAINSGITWFPIYHCIGQNIDERKLVPDGVQLYAYIQF